MTFQIDTFTDAYLQGFSKRVSKEKQAISLGLVIRVGNQILDRFDPTLRPTLYKAMDDQQDLPGVPAELPVLRCNAFNRITLPNKHVGWTLEVDWNGNEDQAFRFVAVTLSGFSIEPFQNGSVDLHFNAATSDIDERRLGWLGMQHREWIKLRLLAPKKAIDGSTEAYEADHPADATDIFAAGQNGPEESDPEGGEPDARAEQPTDVQRTDWPEGSRTARGRRKTVKAIAEGVTGG